MLSTRDTEHMKTVWEMFRNVDYADRDAIQEMIWNDFLKKSRLNGDQLNYLCALNRSFSKQIRLDALRKVVKHQFPFNFEASLLLSWLYNLCGSEFVRVSKRTTNSLSKSLWNMFIGKSEDAIRDEIVRRGFLDAAAFEEEYVDLAIKLLNANQLGGLASDYQYGLSPEMRKLRRKMVKKIMSLLSMQDYYDEKDKKTLDALKEMGFCIVVEKFCSTREYRPSQQFLVKEIQGMLTR